MTSEPAALPPSGSARRLFFVPYPIAEDICPYPARKNRVEVTGRN